MRIEPSERGNERLAPSANQEKMTLLNNIDQLTDRSARSYTDVNWGLYFEKANYENETLSFNLKLEDIIYKFSFDISPELNLTNDFKGTVQVKKLPSRNFSFELDYSNEELRQAQPYAQILNLIGAARASVLEHE